MIPVLDAVELEEIRDDFPILHQHVHGKPLVYLDNAATSQKPRVVIEALNDFYARYNANVHRGIHALAERATREYERAREKIARFIHAESSRSIIFTRGTTEAINLVAYSWGRANLKAGDEILTTWMEHHSNIVPWYQLCAETGAVLKRIPLTADGQLDLWERPWERPSGRDRSGPEVPSPKLKNGLLSPRTKLVALTHCSNVLGTINPIREIADAAHRVGAVVLVDGAQSIPHLPIDVQALGADFFAFSGHKMCGPTGSGVLYGKEHLLDAMPPFFGGGEMIREVTATGFTTNDLPYKFEAGTPNIAEAIGLGVAVDYLTRIGMDKIRQHEIELTAYAIARLRELVEVRLYGPLDPAQRSGLVAFTFGDIHPHDLATIADQHGVAIRAGHHCAMPLHRQLGLAATARASFALYNTRAEVDALVRALKEAKKVFGACPTARQLGY